MVGSVQGLEDYQIYERFKSILMELHVSLRTKESSWPIAFLDVFMPNSVNWLSHLRVQKIFHVDSLFKKNENVLNSKCECVESNSESSESIDNENVSCDYEEMDSRSTKLDDFSQQDEDGYVTEK